MVMQITTQEAEYERLLSWQDLVIRALRNPKFPPLHLRLYLALCDTYPQLLEGKSADVQLWRVRENAGWPAERSVTNFFQDMTAIKAISYDPGKYERQAESRIGHVTPSSDFDAPEIFDIKATERRRKAREAEEKRRNQFKDPRKLEQCEECGSNDIYFDVTPYCASCGHIHRTLKDIPANDIVIEAEVIEVQDNFLDEPTTPRLAVVKPGENITRTITPAPVALPLLTIRASEKDLRGLARPDDFCRRCGRLRRDCFESMEGTWWYTCSDEQAEQWRKAGPHEYSGH